MKRFVFLFPVIASALLSVSCQKELVEGSNVERGDAQFTAILEKVDAGTKTTVEKTWEGSDQIYKTKWESTDTINVNGIRCSATPDSGDPTKAGFTMLPGSTMPSSPFNAYFPASMYDGTTATLPASYVYKKDKYNMPMYAKSNETTLAFKNLCGVLAITVPGDHKFNYLGSLEVISSNKRMNGAFNVDPSGDLSFTSSDDLTDDDKKVTLTMNFSSGGIGTDGSTYYVPVPAGHHDTLTIRITEYFDGKTESMLTKKVDGVDVMRNTVYPVSFVGDVLPLTPDASEPAYCTEFVNIGGKKWAKWNIGATTEASTYKTCFGDYYQWGSLYRFYTDIYFGMDERPDWETMKNQYKQYMGYTDEQIQELLKTPYITFNFKPERSDGFYYDYVNFQDYNVYEPEDIVQRIMKNVTQDEGKWRMPTNEDFNDLIMDCLSGDVPSGGFFEMPPLNSSDPGKGIYYLSAEQNLLSVYSGVAGALFVNGMGNKLFFPLTGKAYQGEVRYIGDVGAYLSKSFGKYNANRWYVSSLDLSKPGSVGVGGMNDEVGYVQLYSQLASPGKNEWGQYDCNPDGFSIRAVNDVLSDPATEAPTYEGSAVGIKIAGFWWAPFNCTATDTDPYVYFQWGRKYGQNATLGTISPETMTKADDTEVNKDKFGSGEDNWFSGIDNGLWRAGKGVGDPCPTGWRVPTKAELEALAAHFSGFVDNGSLKGRWFSGDQTYSESGSRIFLPAAGYRDRYGEVQDTDTGGYYWSSSFSGDGAWCLRFSETEDPVIVTESCRTKGYTVRCIHQY